MTRSSRRGPWLPEEDEALMSLVRSGGPNNWVRISQQIQHRSPKQCRERYHQNLKPSLKHDPISAQEGELIEQMIADMGKRWAEIARRLGNRSDNAVKNWWNGSINRRKRNPAQIGPSFKQVGSRLQPISFPASNSVGSQSHRPSYEPHNTSQWSQTVPPGCRPTALQIPSPTRTTSSMTDGETLNFIHDHRLMTPYSATYSASARSGSGVSESKPELPPLRPAAYLTKPAPATYEPPLLTPQSIDVPQLWNRPPIISSSQNHHSSFTGSYESISPLGHERTTSGEIITSSFTSQSRHLPTVPLPHPDHHRHNYNPDHGHEPCTSQFSDHKSCIQKDTRMHVANLLE